MNERTVRFSKLWSGLARGVAFGLIIGLAQNAPAQTSFPMIGSVYPAGVQRGKTTEVTVYSGGNGGMHLYGAYKVMMEGQGVQAEIVPPEKGWAARDPQKPWAVPQITEVKMKVTVAPDAPLGIREFRVGTPVHGVSTLGLLVIGDEPETLEKEPNNDASQAQGMTLPIVVNGKFQQGEDVDTYKFKAEAGQEVVFSVLCARLEDKIHDLQEHADPLIILKDSSGRELDRSDDYYRADPLLRYKFEKAGEYIVQIRDVGFKGNPHWVYRLNITSRPYIVASVPCAVRPGQSAEVNLYGFNLGAKTARIDIPADAPRGIWTTQLKLPNGFSNAIPLLVVEASQSVLERKPIEESKTIPAALNNAQRLISTGTLTLPGGVNSWLSREAQVDRYTFRAKQGEAWGFEVTARRLNSNIDSELKIRDAKGNVLVANDDFNNSKDSRIDWTAPADGEYSVEVRDLAGHAGPTYFYNLTAQRLVQDFRLKCDTDRAMIAAGNRTTWYVLVERKYGFGGEVRVEVQGLPPGVSCPPVTIPPNMTVGTLFLTAAPDAKIDSSAVRVIGTAQLTGLDGKAAPAQRVAHPVTEIYMPGGGRGLIEAQTQAVAVTEVNDLEVSVNTQQVTLQPGGSVKIEVTIKRRPDYTKPVTLDVRIQHLGGVFVNPLPPGVSIEDATIPENQTKGTITLKAEGNAPPIKDLPIAIFANSSINFVMKVWYSAPPVLLTVEPKK
jgi:hypothetical protein